MSDLHQDFQHLLTSASPEDRRAAINAISQRLTSQQSPSNTDTNGLSALLHAVYTHDPSPSVRTAAINSQFFPSQTIALALTDPCKEVRLASLRKIADAKDGNGRPSALLTRVLALLAVESEEDVLLEALNVLQLLFKDDRQEITHGQIYSILGDDQLSSQDMDTVMDRFEAFGVARDLVEHDSPEIRRAVPSVLPSLAARARAMAQRRDAPPNFQDRITAHCVSILEELMQDTLPAVQMAGVNCLTAYHVMSATPGGTIKVRLSEKTAKCLLRLVEPQLQGNASCSDSTAHILASLKFYPLATLSAYGLVETFLRRYLYSARTMRIQKQRADPVQVHRARAGDIESRLGTTADDGSQMVNILEMNLRDLIKENIHFARVMDLTRSPSDKYGRLLGLNV